MNYSFPIYSFIIDSIYVLKILMLLLGSISDIFSANQIIINQLINQSIIQSPNLYIIHSIHFSDDLSHFLSDHLSSIESAYIYLLNILCKSYIKIDISFNYLEI